MKEIYRAVRAMYQAMRQEYPDIPARELKERIAELLESDACMFIQDCISGEAH